MRLGFIRHKVPNFRDLTKSNATLKTLISYALLLCSFHYRSTAFKLSLCII